MTGFDVELTKSSPAEPELKSATPSIMIAPRSAYKLEWVVQKTCEPSHFLDMALFA